MIDLQDIHTVFLDMDGTLLDLKFDNHFWQELLPSRFAARHGLTAAEADRRLQPLFQATEGRLEWYCLDYWQTQLDLDLVSLKREVADGIAILPHVTEFLEQLRGLSCRVVLLTNAHPASLHIKLQRTLLDTFFDRIMTSHRFGEPKESRDFWPLLASTEPFETAHTLVVDDSLPVLRAARGYGIEHLVAIRRNDSRTPPRVITEFPAIDDFRELMPP